MWAEDGRGSFLAANAYVRCRRGIHYTLWMLLLDAVLGIFSSCRSSGDMKVFDKRRRTTIGPEFHALNLRSHIPLDVNKAYRQKFGEELKA